MTVVHAPPLPPSHLRFRVAGTVSEEEFVMSAIRQREGILSALHRQGFELNSFRNVLDFGCGCGRTLRWLVDAPSPRFFGTDTDAEAIAWCQEHFSRVSFTAHAIEPPIFFADGSFDLVIAISVFTHLYENLHRPWLQELHRTMSQGAYMIVTTFDARHMGVHFTPEQEEQYHTHGFFDAPSTIARLHDYYGTCYLSEEYVRATWSPLFKVMEYMPRGIDSQCLIVLQK